jgi:hypothetical protein
MKKLFVLTLALGILLTLSLPVSARTSVKGYYRKNGTYVAPHSRTSPNHNFYDNWSTKGNSNPYTGQPGYKTSPSKNSYENWSTKGIYTPSTGQPSYKTYRYGGW